MPHRSALFTDREVCEIRKKVANRSAGIRELARHYKVAPVTILRIARSEVYKNVNCN